MDDHPYTVKKVTVCVWMMMIIIHTQYKSDFGSSGCVDCPSNSTYPPLLNTPNNTLFSSCVCAAGFGGTLAQVIRDFANLNDITSWNNYATSFGATTTNLNKWWNGFVVGWPYVPGGPYADGNGAISYTLPERARRWLETERSRSERPTVRPLIISSTRLRHTRLRRGHSMTSTRTLQARTRTPGA